MTLEEAVTWLFENATTITFSSKTAGSGEMVSRFYHRNTNGTFESVARIHRTESGFDAAHFIRRVENYKTIWDLVNEQS